MQDDRNYQTYVSEVGRRIKAYRISKGLSQQDIEDMTGVSKRSITRLEQGEALHTDNLFKILLALGLGDNIDLLVPDQTKRPSYYLVSSANRPKRVRKKKSTAGFKWGDEE